MRLSDEELEAALKEAVDENGEDVRLAAAAREMSAQERVASEENIRRWAKWFQDHQRSSETRKV